MTTPLKQDWGDLRTMGGSGHGGDAAEAGFTTYYVRLFQNKKLVCWDGQAEADSDRPPAKVRSPVGGEWRGR